MNKDLIDDRFGRFREIPLELARKGHQVIGLCLSYKNKEEGWFSDGPVRWRSINAGLIKVCGLLRFIFKAKRLAKEADIIWACSDSFYGVIGCWISRYSGVPVVFDLYDNFESFLMGRLPISRALYRWAVRRSDAVTVVSKPLHQLISSYGRAKGAVVLENAVNLDRFHPRNKNDSRVQLKLPIDAKIIGTAGALFKNRGIEVLFKAFHILESKYPKLYLSLSGPRDIPIPIHPRILDMGILGYEKIPQFFNALDVGIVCNRASAFGKYCFPQKAREMMACNLPIVAADVGSMKDLLTKHKEWLYAPNNPEDLARVIERRLNNGLFDYGPPVSWSDISLILEKLFIELVDSVRF